MLGKGIRVRGRVRGDGDLRVEGTIEGDILVSGAFELGAGATVQGAIQAAAVTVAGAVEGDVAADGPVAIAASGRVRGDVKASELTLDEGGVFVGRIDTDFELPDAIA